MIIYQLSAWGPTIGPRNRRQATVSDGFVFSTRQAGEDFAAELRRKGWTIRALEAITCEADAGVSGLDYYRPAEGGAQ